jgi:hypothetical protein
MRYAVAAVATAVARIYIMGPLHEFEPGPPRMSSLR